MNQDLHFNLSAVFDTIDHEILLERLRFRYGFSNVLLQWFTSYLVDRPQRIVLDKFLPSLVVWSPSRFCFRTGVIFSIYFSMGIWNYGSCFKCNCVRRLFSALHYYETTPSFCGITGSYALHCNQDIMSQAPNHKLECSPNIPSGLSHL